MCPIELHQHTFAISISCYKTRYVESNNQEYFFQHVHNSLAEPIIALSPTFIAICGEERNYVKD
jgi:hypothetical protein